MKPDHIGYLVSDMKQSIEGMSNLGFKSKGEIVYDEDRDIDICFLENGLYCRINYA